MGLRNPLLLKIETSPADSLASSYRPDATASISLQSYGGDFKLVSSSLQEYKFSAKGLRKCGQQETEAEDRIYQISEGDFETLEVLGEGASSIVYKAWWKSAEKYVAIKSINCMEKEKRKQILNDIRGLSSVVHPTLVQFLGAYRVPDSGQISLVLEYLDQGSLSDLTRKVGQVSEAALSSISAQILQGLVYLHRTRHTVHRDIKPANILLNSDGQVKIADFGISAFVDNTLAVCNTFLGTVTYMSPERINSQPYSFAADIWSLGLCLLECVTGKYPFDAAAGPLVLMMQVLREEVPMPGPESMSDALRDFLQRCLHKDPLQRAQAEELLSHPFISQGMQGLRPQDALRDYLLRPGATPSPQDIGTGKKQVLKPTEISAATKAKIVDLIERYFDSMSKGGSDVGSLASDLCSDVKLLHEGVESSGKAAVMRRLVGVCDLQLALGTKKMAVDCMQIQPQAAGSDSQEPVVMVLVNGHLEMNSVGPLGAALMGGLQKSFFASAFEVVKLACGKLAIARLLFRHL